VRPRARAWQRDTECAVLYMIVKRREALERKLFEADRKVGGDVCLNDWGKDALYVICSVG
jgi:hypothetical protein